MKALVVYQHLPHYRYGVFQALDNCADIEFSFAADERSRGDCMPTMPSSALKRFTRLKNHWIGPFLWQKGLLRQIIQGGYDTVVFLGDFAYLSTWIGALLCRLTGKRVAFWTIGWHQRDRGLRRAVRMAFYRLADDLLLYGRVARSIGKSLGYPEARMTVIGNSHASNLDVDEICSDARRQQLLEYLNPIHGDVVGAVIRLNPQKRLDLLLEAAAVLVKRGRKVSVLLVGAGPEEVNLRRLGQRLGLDLIMPGACYSVAELAEVYDRLSITVVPVYAGLTAIQSMKFGRPVITSGDAYNQAPESECIKPGITGAHFTGLSVEGLADSMEELLDQVNRDRDAVSESCRSEIADRWSVEAHCKAIVRALDPTRNS